MVTPAAYSRPLISTISSAPKNQGTTLNVSADSPLSYTDPVRLRMLAAETHVPTKVHTHRHKGSRRSHIKNLLTLSLSRRLLLPMTSRMAE